MPNTNEGYSWKKNIHSFCSKQGNVFAKLSKIGATLGCKFFRLNVARMKRDINISKSKLYPLKVCLFNSNKRQQIVWTIFHTKLGFKFFCFFFFCNTLPLNKGERQLKQTDLKSKSWCLNFKWWKYITNIKKKSYSNSRTEVFFWNFCSKKQSLTMY